MRKTLRAVSAQAELGAEHANRKLGENHSFLVEIMKSRLPMTRSQLTVEGGLIFLARQIELKQCGGGISRVF